MSENIEKLEEIYQQTRLDYFVMAICHLMNIGWEKAEKITDKQLEKCEGNSMMTTDFVVWINKTAREIAKCCEPSGLIAFCAYHDIFDIKSYFEDARENKIRLAIDAINDLDSHYEVDGDDLTYKLEDYLSDVHDEVEREKAAELFD